MIHPHAEDPERVAAEDRAWFEAHPGREYRLRLSAPSEIWEQQHFIGPIPPAVVAVVTGVWKLSPDMRIRAYALMLTLESRPEDASEQLARNFFRHRCPTVTP